MDLFSPQILLSLAAALAIPVGFMFWQTKHSGASSSNQRGILQKYATNFTELARQKKLDPVIGRDREVDQLIRVLSRKTKNNALLLGEPGVGKTAVVERLAQLFITPAAPEALRGKDIIALDLASMVAGTKYRGELEARLESMRHELEAQAGKVILFIDEIQQLGQARGSEGGLNPADILKPELARGYLQVIGATTYEEYEKYIMPDESLERRFQPIHIHEASTVETLNILNGVKPVFEKFHHVEYAPETLQAIVDLSHKYITRRFLPDKAIDVLDESGVRARIESLKQRVATAGAADASIVTVVSPSLVKAVVAEWVDKPVTEIV